MNSPLDQLDAGWTEWLRGNIQVGADFGYLHRQLRATGYSDKAIAAALDQVRPRDSALVAGRLESPPLIRRNPPGLRRLDTPNIEIYTCDNFLSAEECAPIIALANRHLGPSPVSHDLYGPGYRTSRTCALSQLPDPVAVGIDEKISRGLGIRLSYGEGIQAQRYDVGQEYKPHCDCFKPGTREYLRYAAVRGNRTWTFMIYLNDDMEGGATRFTRIDLAVQPKLGMALLWNNLHDDGSPNPYTLHCGEPVTRGHKYIITKWFRIMGDGPVFYE